MVTCQGSIIVLNTMTNSISRPGNLKREKAKAASALDTSTPAMVSAVIFIVFK